MKPIIKVEGVGKQYRLGASQPRYATLREAFAGALRAPMRSLRGSAQAADATFWALRDIDFAVGPGEVVGIIGRNGAGKSTLLKILSRITQPTTGGFDLYGRVGSLLEVGTGFHPELTGRENIYLNGSILGMRRQEINRNFDEIVAFAEIEKFIDTPVKRYSSGMYVRLAFAVAAHLQPEILIVDEVLAVGDGSFQRKCLNKMKDVGQHGRTVLFVSHNMNAITRLCDRTILLEEGRIAHDGPSHKVVGAYLKSSLGTTAMREWRDSSKAPGNEVVRLLSVRVRNEEGLTTEAADIRRPVGIEMQYEVLRPGFVLTPNYHFYNEEGVQAFATLALEPEWRRRPRPAGRYTSTAWVPGNFLAEGSLAVAVAMSTSEPPMIHFYEQDAIAFQVIDSMDGDSARGDYAGGVPGVVRPLLEWKTQYYGVAGDASPNESVGT
jgi:lipopolysaccharide transport system ATP-binding protein